MECRVQFLDGCTLGVSRMRGCARERRVGFASTAKLGASEFFEATVWDVRKQQPDGC